MSTTAKASTAKPSAKATKEAEVYFELERSTKNAVRFSELVENEVDKPVIGTLYIQKTLHTKLGEPETLKVTVAADDGE